jgi:hypothetical protein
MMRAPRLAARHAVASDGTSYQTAIERRCHGNRPGPALKGNACREFSRQALSAL